MKKLLNDKEIDLVHRFLDFELTDMELEVFQNRLETDDVFKNEVERFQKAYLLTEFVDEDGIAPPIPPRNQPDITKTSKHRSLKNALAMIFVLAMFALTGYFILSSQSGNNDEIIYANVENYVDNMSNSITRGEGTTTLSPLELTIAKIEVLNVDENIQPSQLKNLLEETTDIDAQEVIHWWLVKINLKNGDKASAKETLNIISTNTNYNSSRKAKEILESL